MGNAKPWLLEMRLFKLRPGTRAEFDRISREGTIPLMRTLGITVIAHGPSMNNENGYFLLRAAGPDSAVQSLSARVLRDSKVVHEDPRPVTIRLGQSEFREITLGEGPELGTAPVQDTRPKPPAPKG